MPTTPAGGLPSRFFTVPPKRTSRGRADSVLVGVCSKVRWTIDGQRAMRRKSSRYRFISRYPWLRVTQAASGLPSWPPVSTGVSFFVQTVADCSIGPPSLGRAHFRIRGCRGVSVLEHVDELAWQTPVDHAPGEVQVAEHLFKLGLRQMVHRSEERRVGKECRSPWSPY